ncbi:hypothetical protein [Nitrospira sp. Nam74]
MQSYRLSGALLLLITLIIPGCVYVVSVDYLPENPFKGQGTISIGPFQYADSQGGTRHIESNPQGIGRFYMSVEVAQFFAKAVASELTLSGYVVAPTADLNISGRIDRLYYDPVDKQYTSLELVVQYALRLQDKESYEQSVRVLQKMPKSTIIISRLIRGATRESIHQFLNGAREANVLALSAPEAHDAGRNR